MPARKPKKTSSSETDRATLYAEAVIAGEIVAGPHVRNACQRHLDDLARGEARGLLYDRAAADRAIRFFETKLKLSEGQFEGKAFAVHPAQAFIIGSLFGWKKADGFRRFRRAYIEQGKGNGKSPLAGGIGLYGMTADGEAGAQIYSAAATKDQANILFRDAVNMVSQSPDLDKRLKRSGGPGREYNLAHLASGSFFRPISREAKKTGSGPRPHFALCDEVHEHPDRGTMEMLERGFKFRQQPLLFMITNSGSDRNSIAREEHDHAIKVAAGNLDVRDDDAAFLGQAIDDTSFSYVCGLDGERAETFSYCAAMRHMEKSCTCHSVPTTQIDQLQVAAYARHAISAGIVKRAESGVPSTQIGQSFGQVPAASVTRSSPTEDRLRHSLESASINGDGMPRTGTDSKLTRRFGSQISQDIDWQNLRNRLSEITASPKRSSTNSSKSRTASARFAEIDPSGFALIIATVAANIEGCSASPVTQDLVFSEILQGTWNAHSPTCAARKSELQGPSLKVHLPADDPLEDPSCWPKANPLLGVTITEDYLAGVVAQGKAMPGKLNGILRLHFCVWTEADTAWMTREILEPCLADFDPAEHHGKKIFLGGDLSQNRDLTVQAAVVQTGEVDVEVIRDGETEIVRKPTFDAWIEAWTPGDTMEARATRDKLPYPIWATQGFLHAPQGASISYLHVAQTLAEYDRDYDIQLYAYDRFAFRRFEEDVVALGLQIEFVEHPQGGLKKGRPTEEMKQAAKFAGVEPEGLWMPGSVRVLEEALLERRLRLRRNPVLISAMMSAVAEEDKWGNHWLAKVRSVNKIDAAVALAMSMGAATASSTASFYESHDLLVI